MTAYAHNGIQFTRPVIATVLHVTHDAERDMAVDYYRTNCPCTGTIYTGDDTNQAQAEADRHNRFQGHN